MRLPRIGDSLICFGSFGRNMTNQRIFPAECNIFDRMCISSTDEGDDKVGCTEQLFREACPAIVQIGDGPTETEIRRNIYGTNCVQSI